MRCPGWGIPRDVSDDPLFARTVAAVAGLYEIEAEIGRGGMAVVYRARDTRLRRRVALKVLPPELAYRDEVRTRFLREAEMAARLSHPHIVPIYSVDEANGIVFFAMGLVEGESLAARLHGERRLPIPEVRRILREVAEALEYAHSQGVVHRDIKPDNILIERGTGRALVTDFGIARAAEGDQRLTATGIAVGTPSYMSPEQAMGEREVDGRADIYALGIVGYQMLAGELPFQASNTPAMLMKHLSERPRPLAQVRDDLPENLVLAIETALEKGRDQRWSDAALFRAALAEDAPLPNARRARASGGLAVVPPPAASDPIDQLRQRTPLPAPPFPPLPNDWLFDPSTREHGKEALRQWREETRRWKEQVRGQRARLSHQLEAVREPFRVAAQEINTMQLRERTPEERIARVRRKIGGAGATLLMLGAINLFTSPWFPWVLFPAIGLGLGIANELSKLWADGIPLRHVLRRPPPPRYSGAVPPLGHLEARLPAPPADSIAEAILDSVPREVLDGAHGASVREAYDARGQIRSLLARLPESEKALLPEILPTVEALVERVRTLAVALHSLDTDASPDALVRLQRRVSEAEAMPEHAPERTRRIELLQRQLATLTDLAERRTTLARQQEHAVLVLGTMKLDLMKLRSSSVESRLADDAKLTAELRALARDVQRVAEAVDETREPRDGR